MTKGTGVGWRSVLMAPARLVISSGVKRHEGGGQTTGVRKTGHTDEVQPANWREEDRRR